MEETRGRNSKRKRKESTLTPGPMSSQTKIPQIDSRALSESATSSLKMGQDISINELLKIIFGSELNGSYTEDQDLENLHLHNAILHLRSTLENISAICSPKSSRNGRIGPEKVLLDPSSRIGLMDVGYDKLSACSQQNFTTILANTCVFSGKWQYEAQLGSKGMMQIGWAVKSSQFSPDLGVGDTEFSYAYDGYRTKAWNVTTKSFGDEWLSGDIIGSVIDLEDGFIKFYRNGRDLGVAFDKVSLGPGMAYFPGFSLAHMECIVVNFGNYPFLYPIDGYEPLQSEPTEEKNKAIYLLKCLKNVLDCGEKSLIVSDMAALSKDSILMFISQSLMIELLPILESQFIVIGFFINFLLEMSSFHIELPLPDNIWSYEVKPEGKIQKLLDMLWLYGENDEIAELISSLISGILMKYRIASPDTAYNRQKSMLKLLVQIFLHDKTRCHIIENIFFDDIRCVNFIHLKPMEEEGLANAVNCSYWLEPSDESVKQTYVDCIINLKKKLKEMELLQSILINKLLMQNDSNGAGSTRTIFLKKFRRFILIHYIDYRFPIVQIPSAQVLCFFFRMLCAARFWWVQEKGSQEPYVPLRMFCDGSCNYFNMDRLGGSQSHLQKTLRQFLLKEFGQLPQPVECRDFTRGPTQEASTSDSMLSSPPYGPIPLPSTESPRKKEKDKRKEGPTFKKLQNIVHDDSLLHLIDGLLILYHLAAHQQLMKICAFRDSRDHFLSCLREVQNSRDGLLGENSHNTNEHAICVLKKKVTKQTRHLAWVQAFVYPEENQSNLAWLLKLLVSTLNKASEKGTLLSFVPHFYLDSMIEIVISLKNSFHTIITLESIPDHMEVFTSVANFLCEHINDHRMIQANTKDTIVQAIASFVTNPTLLKCLESVPDSSSENLLMNLIHRYEHRAWAISNWILVRFWQGRGFAFRYENSPHLALKLGPKTFSGISDTSLVIKLQKPIPSEFYLTKLGSILEKYERNATEFLHSVLTQLNWAFSEFIGMLQELQNLSLRMATILMETRHLRICATCFDLVLSLLRVLEMVVSIARVTFVDTSRSSSENLLERLCQMLCQILNRVSSQTGCFQSIIDMDIPDLDAIDHFPILTAVIGILIALTKGETVDDYSEVDIPPMCLAILTEPSFQIESVEFVVKEYSNKPVPGQKKKPFSFYFYPNEISEGEMAQVHTLLRSLYFYRSRLKESEEIEEDVICPICYAYRVNTTYLPCHHVSCKSCIIHHLLNSKECFYCKTVITKVIDFDGKIVYDSAFDRPLNRPLNIRD